MQLITLSANKTSFKTVHFKNETGINLIVASQKNPHKSDKGDTTNGVGKSLLIAIIHFCLGSSSKQSFKNKLTDWEFTLKFKIKDKIYESKRSTKQQNKILLNNEELSRKEFNQKMEKLLIDMPGEIKELSFRSLLAFFIRPRKSSYIHEANPNAVKKDYQVQLANAFLLGLDVLIAEEKYQLKLEKDRIKNLVNDLKNDKFINEFFSGDKDITLAKSELNETIENLEINLKNFEVADDYYEIKEQADKLKYSLENIHNDITLKQIQVENINESLKISPDIKRENIERIYKEAFVILKEDAIKKLSELEKFYKHLSKNRENRLLEQKNQLNKQIDLLLQKKQNQNNELNGKLKYLDAHQALDVFIKLSEKLSDAKSKRDNLHKFEELIFKYKDESRKIDKRQIEENEKTVNYLSEATPIIAKTNDFFRSLIKRFYPKSASGITIYNNEGENQIRYNIEAKIEADKSDGIANVKLFSYDLTLLLNGYGHKIDFLFHDSRLLDGIDPRQKHELFIILNEYIKKNNKQYIITANFNQLEELKQYFTPSEYDNIIKDNIILELKDNSHEGKLLGIQVDIDYD
ncbi:MAG: DUF2326 domain-containing protein [Bacteroidales bacterium]|nr:DUF2326 domain-containing protein [Bacteroidales bacterium]